MMENRCLQCGAPIKTEEPYCPYCGESLPSPSQAEPTQGAAEQGNSWSPHPYESSSNVSQYQYEEQSFPSPYLQPAGRRKKKITAGVLAIILGGLGIHKFYLGRVWMGILYLFFCWTAIPAFLGLIEGILYLCCTEEQFQYRYVR